MSRLLSASALITTLLSALPGVQAQDLVFKGHCDGSAGVDLGGGRYAIADDDSPDLFVMSRDGTAKGKVELAAALDSNKVKKVGKLKPKEPDTEGAARIGQRIYWVASHGLKKDKDSGKVEPDPYRLRFFATDIPSTRHDGKGLPLKLAAPYRLDLKEALLANQAYGLLQGTEGKEPEADGGFNIEGLAEGPDGSLLIGFRNPVRQGMALAAMLTNPAEVINKGKGQNAGKGSTADYQWGPLLKLDLGGRGIRSIEKVGEEWWIMAGPFNSAPPKAGEPAFALYRWAGAAQGKPVFVQGFDEAGFRPEGMFLDAEAKTLVLLSDNGDDTVHGKKCKDHEDESPKREFKVRFLKWPLPGVKKSKVQSLPSK